MLLCETNHVLESDYSEVIVVGAGTDAIHQSGKWYTSLPSRERGLKC